MASSRASGLPRWKAQRTLLVVGEGAHDVAFVKHVKGLFAPRGCGLCVTTKDARGKGASHVIDVTCRLKSDGYDQRAAMFDTDTDWTAAARKKAERNKIVVLTSDPYLEALLLRIVGRVPSGAAVEDKERIKRHLSGDPIDASSYAEHFSRERLLDARVREPTLDKLLSLLEVR